LNADAAEHFYLCAFCSLAYLLLLLFMLCNPACLSQPCLDV